MSRFVSALALLTLATASLAPDVALAQTPAGLVETAGSVGAAELPALEAAPPDLSVAEAPRAPASLALPRAALSYLPTPPTGAERGIEEATAGVWIGGLAGIVAGGLIASWAYCGLGEGDCGFSFTAAGPGMLIGGILGASIGGLLDQDRDPRGEGDDGA